MRKKTTVLVVGAGASNELHFPLGRGLARLISELAGITYTAYNRTESPKNPEFVRLCGEILVDLAKYPGDTSDVWGTLRKLSGGVHLTYSVDNYLALHPSDKSLARVAKLAIAHIISEYERASPLRLFADGEYQPPRLLPEDTWFGHFFRALTNQCKFSDLPERFKDVCIICFNYDRNIQRFFQLALMGLYDVPEVDANEVVKCLRIWHPYGSLGPLPGLSTDAVRAYGTPSTVEALAAMADGIKTFTEGSGSSTGIPRADVQEYLRTANRFAFLGFGFLPANMKLLTDMIRESSRDLYPRPNVFGTCFKASEFDREQYSRQLAEMIQTDVDRVHLTTAGCSELFTQYSAALRFG